MIVISDNSALSALAEAEMLDLLPRLFKTITIPETVYSESMHANAPILLKQWLTIPPAWLQILPDPEQLLPETAGLDGGEAAAITMAFQQRGNVTLILDEKRGRRVAEALGLKKIGTLAIIGEAASRKWIDFDEALLRLDEIGFHVSESVIETIRSRIARDR